MYRRSLIAKACALAFMVLFAVAGCSLSDAQEQSDGAPEAIHPVSTPQPSVTLDDRGNVALSGTVVYAEEVNDEEEIAQNFREFGVEPPYTSWMQIRLASGEIIGIRLASREAGDRESLGFTTRPGECVTAYVSQVAWRNGAESTDRSFSSARMPERECS